jgi:hypothetical protein
MFIWIKLPPILEAPGGGLLFCLANFDEVLLAKTENLAGETGKREASNKGGLLIWEGVKARFPYSRSTKEVRREYKGVRGVRGSTRKYEEVQGSMRKYEGVPMK